MNLPEAKQNYRILLLATKGVSTNIVYNTLTVISQNTHVIIEEKKSKKQILKRRIVKLGLGSTIGQLAFQLLIPPLLNIFSRRRVNSIIESYSLNTAAIPLEEIQYVESVNNNSIISLINEIKPDIIIVNGTRIISSRIIEQVTCPIINIHVGITPLYRGIHGGYWALYNNDRENLGVTIHYVDKGIDTGKIIRQFEIKPEKNDNFSTYPLLQYAIACNHLREVINTVIQNNTEGSLHALPDSTGNVYYHPTLLQYVFARLRYNIK